MATLPSSLYSQYSAIKARISELTSLLDDFHDEAKVQWEDAELDSTSETTFSAICLILENEVLPTLDQLDNEFSQIELPSEPSSK